MLNKSVKLALIFMILALIITSCSGDYYYNSEIEIPKTGWYYKKAAIFEPQINDTSQVFNLILELANNDEYRYNNIWFFVKTSSPNGAIHKDTLEYFISKKDGEWIGNKQGDMWLNKMYFRNSVRFPKLGKYKIEIWQGMREDTLKGVEKIGVLMEKL